MTEIEKKRKRKKKVYSGYLDHFQFIPTRVYCRNYFQRRMRIFITKLQKDLKGYNCLLVNYDNYRLAIN